MKIYHTSPEKIEKIHDMGIFSDCLFFSNSPYFMTTKSDPVIYSIEIDDDEIIDISDLYDEETIIDIQNYFDINDDNAYDMLRGKIDPDGEGGWWIQGIQGQCGRKLGYRAVRARDEQGTVYIVSMLNREQELHNETLTKERTDEKTLRF